MRKLQYIKDLADNCGLGQTQVHPYPSDSPLAKDGLANLTIDVGDRNTADELMLIIAHCDTVPPSPDQEKGLDGDIFKQRGSSDMLGQVAGVLYGITRDYSQQEAGSSFSHYNP